MCPMTMQKMAKTAQILSQKEGLIEKINFVMISIDPDRDSPERVNQYAKAFNKEFKGVSGNIKGYLSAFVKFNFAIHASD